MLVAFAILLVVVGSVLFHLLSPWWWTPVASNWGTIDTTITITFWITGLVFTAVGLFVAYCVFRFRHRPGGERPIYEPENRKLEGWLTGLTAVGVAAMLAPGLLVWKHFITVPPEAADVEAVGQQWQWTFRLPGDDGRLGRTAIRLVGPDNPLGIDPADPAGSDDIVVDGGELHLPTGQPIRVLLRSTDVLHDFYVPEFRAKMDLIPGMVTYFWLTPTRSGTFDILCAELCGVGHAFMRGSVVVEDAVAYRSWLEDQKGRMVARLATPSE
ncbi:cytochrome c oxidase subunit II [Chthonobacter rhizosphaerae]|uniref:cytochrome c oxidase subunit II n=1 Tax=Chthonobacter rhizosphaerae TaxID=2735553 RepID=UPI0015EE4F53|nr:cytochrome c oxidase subunit II [Chthonobacter rhizosphaerae]